MKILHVTNLYPYKGAPTYGIFVKEQIESLNNPEFQDVFFINARLKGYKEYFNVIKVLRPILKNYDLVHCHHHFSAFSVFLADPKIKIIVSILGDIKKRSRLNKVIYQFIKKRSDIIIFKNEIPANSIKNKLLPNGVNFEFFKPNNQLESKNYLNLDINKKYILFVSNGDLNNPIKRHDKFIEVFNKFTNNFKNKGKVEVLYLNKVERKNVPYFYNAADLMIVTSDHEGSPNAVKEAMACNLPIISTPVGDVPTLLKEVKNSFVSKNGSVEDLLSLLKKIDFETRSNGRERLTTLGLDSKSVAEKLINIYSELYKS